MAGIMYILLQIIVVCMTLFMLTDAQTCNSYADGQVYPGHASGGHALHSSKAQSMYVVKLLLINNY